MAAMASRAKWSSSSQLTLGIRHSGPGAQVLYCLTCARYYRYVLRIGRWKHIAASCALLPAWRFSWVPSYVRTNKPEPAAFSTLLPSLGCLLRCSCDLLTWQLGWQEHRLRHVVVLSTHSLHYSLPSLPVECSANPRYYLTYLHDIA